MLAKTVTGSFAGVVHGLTVGHLTESAVQRSKRMILDTLGVGLLGTQTEVFHKVLQYSKMYSAKSSSTVWGQSSLRLPPLQASFANGVAVHSMDFDDTWHPATHPSGAVLPTLIAISEAMPPKKYSGLDLLLAFNVGIEVQGRLMRFSSEASDIPKRFHPPAVVGTIGSAAAAAKFMGLDQSSCREALAIAASYSGAPMANAATQTKPLHIGNAAKNGLEAACLAYLGLEGNKQILDLESGFGAFYADYAPKVLPSLDSYSWLLDSQDVAFKRFPAHLGMHWVADAACSLRKHLVSDDELLPGDSIQKIILKVPDAKYVNRPFPSSEHEARHSFQYNACSALLDGEMSVSSFSEGSIHRPQLKKLLEKVEVEHPLDNKPNFEKLYCEISVMLQNGTVCTERCDTFYGHWRKPLSQADLVKKFRSNASTVLSKEAVDGIIGTVGKLEDVVDCSVLSSLLRLKHYAATGHFAQLSNCK